MLMALSVGIMPSVIYSAFSPQNRTELKRAERAVDACLKLSPRRDCTTGQHGPIGSWDVSAVTNMHGMFSFAESFNQDLSAWDVSAVTDMHDMFCCAHFFNQDLSAWDVSAVTDMHDMFYCAYSFNQDLSKWDVSTVTDMHAMFYNAHSFNQNLSAWDVSAVTHMSWMFGYAQSFNQDLSMWDVSAVTDMTNMFRGATSFDHRLCGVSWVNSKATQVNMFTGSSGSISLTVCTATSTTTTTTNAVTSTINTATTSTIATATTTTKTITSAINTASTTTTTTTTTMDIKATTTTIEIAVCLVVAVIVVIGVVVVMIVFAFRMNMASGETPTTEMPLLTHNAPMTPSPDPVFASLTTKTNPSIVSAEEKSSTTDPALTSPTPAETNPSTTVVPLTERTFATSHYKRLYTGSHVAPLQHYLLYAVMNMLKLYAKRVNRPLELHNTIFLDVQSIVVMKKIQDDAFKHDDDVRNDVDAMAEYLWTSSEKHHIAKDMELCSVINAVIRDDVAEEIKAAIIIFRSLNSRRIRRTNVHANINLQSYPPKGETWRGGGFRREHRAFFERMIGKKYRVPGFLATSDNRQVAAAFALKADKAHPCAMWRITFDPRGKDHPEYRVKHMAFVSKTLVVGEREYLFAPYSVFTLVSVKWSAKLTTPHEFTIRAALDNKEEEEDLPLSPWY